MKTICVGIVGLGAGAAHLAAARKLGGCRVTALCDVDRSRLKRAGNQYRIPRLHVEYAEMLNGGDLDAVIVATPDHLHRQHVLAALRRGLHVLCEKPLALTLADCDAMVRAARQSDRILMVGQSCRYAPGFRLAKRLITAGALGKLFFVESEYAHDYSHMDRRNWRKDPSLKRPIVVGGGCHAMDLLRWVAGEPVQVVAYSNHKMLPDWPVDDTVIAILRFENDAIGKLFCSMSVKRPYTMRSVFCGSKGTIVCDNTSRKLWIHEDGKDVDGKQQPVFRPVSVQTGSHNFGDEIKDFLLSIRSGKRPECDVVQGARTVLACLAAKESAVKNMPININSKRWRSHDDHHSSQT